MNALFYTTKISIALENNHAEQYSLKSEVEKDSESPNSTVVLSFEHCFAWTDG